MESQQIQSFHERLNQWVASQGFWFQMRHSLTGRSLGGKAMFHAVRLALRFFIFLLLVAAATWIYLVNRVDSTNFRSALESRVTSGIGAKDLKMSFQREQGQLEITRLGAEGNQSTFFSSLEIRNIRCRMGLLDGLIGTWDPGVISVSRVDMDLRAGTDDSKSAASLGDIIFQKPRNLLINTIEVFDASLRWGYSPRTQGSITSSDLTIQRIDTGWRLVFKGGTFSQNWLKDLDIVELVVICERDRILFEKADLRRGKGTVNFSGLSVTTGERPEPSGTVRIRNIDLESILPPSVMPILSGSISSDLVVSGSTNTSDGVAFRGMVTMDGTDVISLRERIHILKALSVVDYSRNYHRVDFNEGAFIMRTVGGGLTLSDIKLTAEDHFTMSGNISVRLPTEEEVKQAVERGTSGDLPPIFETTRQGEPSTAEKEEDFSLRRAAQEAKRVQEGLQDPASLDLFERLGLGVELRKLQAQAADRMSRMLRYEGSVLITIPPDAFERAPRLQALYPVDPATGRIPIRVPIEGNLQEVTLKQAEDLYEQGQRKRAHDP